MLLVAVVAYRYGCIDSIILQTKLAQVSHSALSAHTTAHTAARSDPELVIRIMHVCLDRARPQQGGRRCCASEIILRIWSLEFHPDYGRHLTPARPSVCLSDIESHCTRSHCASRKARTGTAASDQA